ncbi:isopeptide-forming domain-containing fimbrial protein [Bifidobacterium thermophilum]|uniref:isopeptide-forming domain-containing fimbrial protein n=1 Tax=Bifidobacterium thermophilum TaxID=33905 RepID=UPI003F910D88
MIRHHGITRALTGLAAALLATAGIMPAANAADTSTATSVRVDSTNETLTITAPTGQSLDGHTFTAVELAKIIDATAVDGKITETAVSTNSNLTANITTAAKTAGATDADLTPDPMTWVAKTLTDSDTSPYAGKLRDFVTALANDTTVTKAATLPLTVSGNTATLTGEPGVYLVFDKATGAASLPILAATTIGHMTDKDGRLGAVDWKALTAPAPSKTLTGINGTAPANPAKGIVNVGDKLTYKISQPVPATTGYAHYTFTVTDTMPKALTGPNDLTVAVDGTTLTQGAGYTMKLLDGALTPDGDTGTTTFTITLGGDDHDALPVIAGHKTITVTYGATVNGNARRDTSIDNTATTAYSDNPADWTHTGTVTVPTPVSVHTGGLTVKKTDRTGKPLSGAEFTLSVSGTPMKFTKQSDGVYTPDPNGTSTLTTGTDGLIKIDGIADKQIVVTETKSPYGGSILPSFGATVHVNDTTGKASLIQTAESDNYGLVTAPTDAAPDTVTVMNVQSLLQLPRTGLAGILLTAVPLTLLLAAGMLLTVKARRK